jgi:phosphoglycolate phosphatase
MDLLFDLDGTLTDSFPGIHRAVDDALTAVGRAPTSAAELRGLVGAPLAMIFRALLGTCDDATLDRALSVYRTQFDAVGIFENRLFPGIAAALQDLQARGHVLQVVTARSARSARHVVQHFELDRYFVGVHGPDQTQDHWDKSGLVRAALHAVSARTEHAVMVGDRAQDVAAARAHGIHAVAVAWGYGSAAELHAAQPDHLAADVDDLTAWIRQTAGRVATEPA